MSGRNSKPDKNGGMPEPSRLDQFGAKLAEDTAGKKGGGSGKNSTDRC